VLFDPTQAQRSNHGTEPEGREEQPVAVRVQTKLLARDQRQECPHRTGGHHEGSEAQQDLSDDRLVAHVAAPGHQSGHERFSFTVGNARPDPPRHSR
jgi:hypothetical protein